MEEIKIREARSGGAVQTLNRKVPREPEAERENLFGCFGSGSCDCDFLSILFATISIICYYQGSGSCDRKNHKRSERRKDCLSNCDFGFRRGIVWCVFCNYSFAVCNVFLPLNSLSKLGWSRIVNSTQFIEEEFVSYLLVGSWIVFSGAY